MVRAAAMNATSTLERLGDAATGLARTASDGQEVVDLAKGRIGRAEAGVIGARLTSVATAMDDARRAFDEHLRATRHRISSPGEGRAAYEQSHRALAELGATLRAVGEGAGSARDIPRLKGAAVRGVLDAMPHIEDLNRSIGTWLSPYGARRVGGNALALDASTHARRFGLEERHLQMARDEVHLWADVEYIGREQQLKRAIEGMNPPPPRPY